MGKKVTANDFIEKAKYIYGDKYDYSKVKYVNARTNVCIICQEHGEFFQTPDNHLHGHSCPKCNHRSYQYEYEEWVNKANEVHDYKYDYSKVEYVNNRTKICIICPKHGEFWQTPHDHLAGCGCKKCKMSKLEKKVYKILVENNIDFMYDVRNLSFLNKLTFDFYLPKYSIGIECQGIQHFKDSRMLKCDGNIKRDKLKKYLCDNNGVKIIYFSDLKIDFPYNVITNENDLLNEIYRNGKI